MMYMWILLITFAGGLVQAVTGFGGGIVIMTVLPNLVSMNLAPAISNTICTPLACAIAWKYRKHASVKTNIILCLAFMAASTVAIEITARVEMNHLKPVFVGFLVLMGLYSLFFSDKVTVRGNLATALFCSCASGLLAGLFGIGGPFMVLYYLAVTRTKEEYLENINFLFGITAVQ